MVVIYHLCSVFQWFGLILIFFLFSGSFKFVDSGNTTIYNCDQSNCFHGVCWSQSTDYKTCYCDNGFTGYQCSINYDDCLLNQCQNGGTCVDKVADFDCLCPPGYTGKLCQTEINECISSSCLSGGSCIDEVNGFRCQCLPGFSGPFCEIDISVCNETGYYDGTSETTTKCLNGGQCSEGPGLEFKCHCPPGFEGDRCETIINQCEPNPCFNGSRCINAIGDFYCVCPPDRTGKICENLLVPCEINDCQHGAICLTTTGSTRSCYCVPGFYGIHCERHFNECMPAINVCANDGLCIGGSINYSCSCLNGFKGKHCEINCSKGEKNSPVDPRCSNGDKLFPPSGNITETSFSTTTLEPSMRIDYPTSESISPSESLLSSTSHQQLTTPIIHPIVYNESTVDYESSTTVPPSPSSNVIAIGSITTSKVNSSSIILHDNSSTSSVNDQKYLTDTTNIQSFYRPLFNGKSSYMVITSNEDQYISSLTINFAFCTFSPNGTLISTHSTIDSRYFIIIYLSNFRLKVWFSCNSREMILMEFPDLISPFNFYPLTFQLVLQNNTCTARLTLNHNYTVIDGQSVSFGSSPIIPLWPCFRDFYLGLMDPSLRSLAHIENDNNHFNGSLKEINIEGANIIKEIVDITEYQVASICDNNPCNGRGRCLQSSTNWSCLCQPGYSGRRCQLANCSPNPCLNDGLCLTTGSSAEFNCLCNNGWFGDYCQLDFNSSLPAFGYKDKGLTNSYMIYELPSQTFHFEMKLRLITSGINQNNSLILFAGNNNNGIRLRGRPTDFISLSQLDNMIFYQINMGSGTKVMMGKMNNTQVHTVYIGQHRQLAWLIVDGLKRDLELVKTRHDRLTIEPYLYIGNHKASPLRTFTTFQGCVFDIEVRNDPKLPFKQLDNVLWSSNVHECLSIYRCKKG